MKTARRNPKGINNLKSSKSTATPEADHPPNTHQGITVMKTTLLSALSVVALLCGVQNDAKAQTTIVFNTGSSFGTNRSTTYGYGPGGSFNNTTYSGSKSQYANVGISAYTPVGTFNGNFGSGSAKTWGGSYGSYNGPSGSGDYNLRNGSNSNWNNSNWNFSGPGGVVGGNNSNVNRTTWSNGVIRTYP